MMRINKSGRTLCVSVVLLTVYSQTAYAQSSGGNFTITSQVVAAGGCGSDGSGGCTQSIGGNKLMGYYLSRESR